MEPDEFLNKCDTIEGELDTVMANDGPVRMPELRDRIVELMELGVLSSTTSLEWLAKRIKDLETGE
jgi:hypothetical protein